MIHLKVTESECRTQESSTKLLNLLETIFPGQTITPDFISGYIICAGLDLGAVYEALERNNKLLDDDTILYKLYAIILDEKHTESNYHTTVCLFDSTKSDVDKIIYVYNKEPEMIHFGKVLQNKQSNTIPVESEIGIQYEVKHGNTLSILRAAGMTAPTALAMVLGRIGVTNIQRSKTREGYSLISIPDARLLDLENISQQFISAFPIDVLKVLFNRKDITVDLTVDKYYNLSERFITEIVPVVDDANIHKYRIYTENNLTRILRDRYSVVRMDDVFSKMLQICPELKSIEKTGTNRISIETTLPVNELYTMFSKLKIQDIVKTLYIKKETYYTKIDKTEIRRCNYEKLFPLQ